MNSILRATPLFLLLSLLVECAPTLPKERKVEYIFLNQNWDKKTAEWFHHTPQGTRLMPYAWFMALEQPELTLFGTAPPFHDPGYMSRFGFIPSPKGGEEYGKLPIGFARNPAYVNPTPKIEFPPMDEKVDMVDLSCAACHTGQIDYKGKGIVVEGGAAMVSFDLFLKSLGTAATITYYDPFRFNRFAENVLKDQFNDANKERLKKQLRLYMDDGLAQLKEEKKRGKILTEEGFGRLDALARIGNFVFGMELDEKNIRPIEAPVNFPHLWDTSWFDFIQYNGGIKQPMVRNVGEALGVQALVNLVKSDSLFRSTVMVENLHLMEKWLAGDAPFQGLSGPAWPEAVLGKIDRRKAARGAKLYRKYCMECHFPPIPELIRDRKSPAPKYWARAQEEYGKKKGIQYLKIQVYNIAKIGTDPTESLNFYHRTADSGPLNLGVITAAEGLHVVTESVANAWYEANMPDITPQQKAAMNGYRLNIVLAPLGYKARPLNGVWATPPFLHNGSVPSIYQLLIPVNQRDKTFFLGNKEFDPVHLGYATESFEGGFKLDTSKKGNYNTGHEFSDNKGPGVIGPELSEEERMALIEYLKTI